MSPRVLLTRSESGALVAGLQAAGCEVISVPLVERRIVPAAAQRCADAVAAPDVLLLTSSAAVEAIGKQHAALQPARVAAVGDAVARARAFGWQVDVVLESGSTEALQAALGDLGGRTLLFPSAGDVPGGAIDALQATGAVVHRVVVYEDVEPANVAARIAAAGSIDLVVLFAPHAARRLAGHTDARPPAITVGPSTTLEARAQGFAIGAVASGPSPDAMLSAARAALGLG